MSDIFISYAKEDRDRAKVLAGALERQGWSVWWDRKILPGAKFSQVIKEAIDEAQCVIVLWSKESVKSGWVQNEAAEGSRRKILVPVLIDDVDIPPEFSGIQAANLIGWEGTSPHAEFDRLTKALCEHTKALGEHANALKNSGEEQAIGHLTTAMPLHFLIVSILGILALASIGGGIYAIVRDSESDTYLSILGTELSTGHVGVALVGIGFIITFFTIRAVLKSQRDLAALPPDKSHITNR